ncbi:MAG: TetR/AcrR family transcriptional regulator, tetracycline repressor protein [Pseudonocardiales bacterium]|nr:TetR/AcrR family transcriptional regulator, tetracycline repressor protein [Pseudonocardiales bacterium]
MTGGTKPDRGRLDRDTVVARALALVDAEGLEALTIRRLAVDLGVTPMALYWHFRNKDELLDALVEHLLGTVRLPALPAVPAVLAVHGRDWVEQLHAALTAFAAALRPHPAIAPLIQARVLFSAPGLALAERALGLLREGGFTAEQAAQIGGYLVGAVVTLVVAEPGVSAEPDLELRDSHTRARQAALRSLSPSDYPNVIACAEPLTFCANGDAYFAQGIDLLVAGVRGVS